MTEHSEKYWNNLIDQYKEGTISETNRYALEKKALDDPFLFDALEGYSLYGERSSAKTKKSKLITLPRIAAAASLVFLVSMVFLLKDDGNMHNSSREQIAMVLEDQKIAKDTDDSSEEYSTTKVNETPKTTTSTESKNSDGEKVKTKMEAQSKRKTNSQTAPTEVKKKPQPVITEEEIEQEQADDVEVTPKASTFDNVPSQGSVVANTQSASSNQSESEDIIAKKDSYDYNLDTEEMADISVSPNKVMKAKAKKEENPLASYAIEPLIGKTDFEDFARQTIAARSDLKQNPTQEIVIEFLIKKDGTIDDFVHIKRKVVEGEIEECSECASIAIGILTKSGVWKTIPAGQEGKARYTFEF